MPRNVIGQPPFGLRVIDTDEALTQEDIMQCLEASGSVSLCIRSAQGHPRRGGYFFHLRQDQNQRFIIHDFAGQAIDSLDLKSLTRFINHVSGRMFDREMLVYCERVVNFNQDQIDPGIAVSA